MELLGIFGVVGVVTWGFLQELNQKKEKPSAEEALGNAIGKYLESGIKINIANKG